MLILQASEGVAVERALPPHAVGAVRSLLQLATPLAQDSEEPVQLSATIERDRIAVVGRDPEGGVRLAVTLVHRDGAPSRAELVGGLGLLMTPGPAPGPLVALLRARLSAREVALPWVTIEREPEEGELSERAVERQDWSTIDRWLSDGALREARAALAEIATPEDRMALAHLALRWRLAGDPARAAALVAGRDAEQQPHAVLALRIARGDVVRTEEALEALPRARPCEAVDLSALWRRGGECDQASAVADEIVTRQPSCAEAAYEAVQCHTRSGRLRAAEAVLERAAQASPSPLALLQAKSALLTRAGDHAAAWRVEVQIATRRLAGRGVLGGARFLIAWVAEELQVRWQALVTTLTAKGAPQADGEGAEARWCPQVANLSCLRLASGGDFLMGAQSTSEGEPGFDAAAAEDEAPVRRVSIAPLYAMETEVDVRSYTACVRAGGCRVEDVQTLGGYFNYGQPLRADHPVNGVSWAGASRYCAWIGGRLPTEAEWEFLARGADGRRFPWGDEVPECGAGGSRSGHQGCPVDGTRPPGILVESSAAGLTSMGSGVWEWVSDWYGPYDAADLVNPAGPKVGADRVQRGGGWTTEEAIERRASYRASMPPDARASDVGFRCVRSR
ncbi:MAG: SUMF1/EgtB/PvdO family nonheme iron enzyme [Myxococcota bacterium]